MNEWIIVLPVELVDFIESGKLLKLAVLLLLLEYEVMLLLKMGVGIRIGYFLDVGDGEIVLEIVRQPLVYVIVGFGQDHRILQWAFALRLHFWYWFGLLIFI